MKKTLLVILFAFLFLGLMASEFYFYNKEKKDYSNAMDKRDSLMVKNFGIQ